jgi:hypothetical protein
MKHILSMAQCTDIKISKSWWWIRKKNLNIILLKNKKNKYLIDEIYIEINNNLKIKNKK